MYNREAGKKTTGDDRGAGNSKATNNNDDAETNGPVGAGAAVAQTLVRPSPAEQKSPSV